MKYYKLIKLVIIMLLIITSKFGITQNITTNKLEYKTDLAGNVSNRKLIIVQNFYNKPVNNDSLISNINVDGIQTNMKLYPNPTNGDLSITFSNEFKKYDIIFYLTDNIGRNIKIFKINGSTNIDISDIPIGNYYLVNYELNVKYIVIKN